MPEINRESLKNDLIRLGVVKGDLLYITIDSLRVGFFEKKRSQTLNVWIELLLEVLGDNGSFILSAYTKTFWRFNKKKIIFTRYSKTNNGALSNHLIKHKDSIRSKHPTNSVIGIGYDIENILLSHDENSKCYGIFEEIIKRKGKFLMIGTLDKKNAPQAMHYCQEILGYNDHFFGKNLIQTYYKDVNNYTKTFTLKDSGGCSRGGYKLIGPLVINDSIDFGYVGKAYSAIMDGEKSMKVIFKELKKNRNVVQCDNKHCLSCYGDIYNSGLKVFPFYLMKLFNEVKNKLRK